jgi:hypothetical protein
MTATSMGSNIFSNIPKNLEFLGLLSVKLFYQAAVTSWLDKPILWQQL